MISGVLSSMQPTASLSPPAIVLELFSSAKIYDLSHQTALSSWLLDLVLDSFFGLRRLPRHYLSYGLEPPICLLFLAHSSDYAWRFSFRIHTQKTLTFAEFSAVRLLTKTNNKSADTHRRIFAETGCYRTVLLQHTPNPIPATFHCTRAKLDNSTTTDSCSRP